MYKFIFILLTLALCSCQNNNKQPPPVLSETDLKATKTSLYIV